MRAELKTLEGQLTSLHEKGQPLVFFHMAKTGGSSIWWALTGSEPNSAAPPIPVVDLYHHSRCDYHAVTNIYQVLTAHKDFLRGNRVLVHHHSAHPIGLFFERQPLYTTIVRDPVDRLISEVNHVRSILQGDLDVVHQAGHIDPKIEMEGRGWSRELVEKASSPDVSFDDLLESALNNECFLRYYYWNFYYLLLGAPEGVLDSKLPQNCPSIGALAVLVKSKFAFIGCFPRVYESYVEIARIYKIPTTRSNMISLTCCGETQANLSRIFERILDPPLRWNIPFFQNLDLILPAQLLPRNADSTVVHAEFLRKCIRKHCPKVL